MLMISAYAHDFRLCSCFPPMLIRSAFAYPIRFCSFDPLPLCRCVLRHFAHFLVANDLPVSFMCNLVRRDRPYGSAIGQVCAPSAITPATLHFCDVVLGFAMEAVVSSERGHVGDQKPRTEQPTEAMVAEDGDQSSFKDALEHLNDDLDSGMLEEDLQELATVQAHGRQTFQFLEEDEEFQKVLAEGGANPSIRVDSWALNRLNSFREFKKMDISVPFYNLPNLEIVDLLTRFFEQVCKLDGSFYPSQSLMSLYRSFHRMIRKNQELRIQRIGVEELPLSLKDSAVFKLVGRACVATMRRSRDAGANLPRKKSSVISLADESVILNHACTAKTNARGLQRRAAFYLLSRFCIRGGAELYNLLAIDFMFGQDEVGQYVRYDERLSKNYKISMERYQEEHFRPSITEHDLDVVVTMELLISHLPEKVNTPSKFLFYQAIDNPRSNAWFSSSRVSSRNLCKWLKLIHEECGLLAEGITNKSGRTTCVTRMAVEGVPPAVGMLLTGHKSSGAYARYDRSTEAQVRAAQKSIALGNSFDSNMKREKELLKDKMVAGAQCLAIELAGSSSKKPRSEIEDGMLLCLVLCNIIDQFSISFVY
jgi:hypothetical protein